MQIEKLKGLAAGSLAEGTTPEQPHGCYMDEAGTVSDLPVNDELAHQLRLVSIWAMS